MQDAGLATLFLTLKVFCSLFQSHLDIFWQQQMSLWHTQIQCVGSFIQCTCSSKGREKNQTLGWTIDTETSFSSDPFSRWDMWHMWSQWESRWWRRRCSSPCSWSTSTSSSSSSSSSCISPWHWCQSNNWKRHIRSYLSFSVAFKLV